MSTDESRDAAIRKMATLLEDVVTAILPLIRVNELNPRAFGAAPLAPGAVLPSDALQSKVDALRLFLRKDEDSQDQTK